MGRSNSTRKDFYPEIEPFRTGRLRVSDLHELYYEEVGNPQGKPVVFLHGGPGAGLTPMYRRAFDPAGYRIVLFDQRGCGQSTPFGQLKENTTWDIVADIEKLREHLDIEKWQVFGGSWGGSLALVYAQAHPERATEIILRGPFLWRRKDIEWDFGDCGVNTIYPEAWDRFVEIIPQEERSDLVAAYYERLTSDDVVVRRAAAKAWGDWESCKISLLPDDTFEVEMADVYADVISLFECHYTINSAWLHTDNQILDDMHKIKNIPGIIVCGRYDTITPMESSWALAKAWPKAELKVVNDAGHAFFEPGIIHEMVDATDGFLNDG